MLDWRGVPKICGVATICINSSASRAILSLYEICSLYSGQTQQSGSLDAYNAKIQTTNVATITGWIWSRYHNSSCMALDSAVKHIMLLHCDMDKFRMIQTWKQLLDGSVSSHTNGNTPKRDVIDRLSTAYWHRDRSTLKQISGEPYFLYTTSDSYIHGSYSLRCLANVRFFSSRYLPKLRTYRAAQSRSHWWMSRPKMLPFSKVYNLH